VQSTADGIIRLDRDRRARSRMQVLYRTFAAVVTAIVVFAVVEEVAGWHGYGMDHHTTRAEGGGYELEVTYATVTRGGLATPLSITVRGRAPITTPLTLSISQPYIDGFLTSGVSPQPSSEASTGDAWLVTLEPSGTDEITLDWDMTARPSGWFVTRHADIAVLDENGHPAATVKISTGIRP
jgi:hypothetical protein